MVAINLKGTKIGHRHQNNTVVWQSKHCLHDCKSHATLWTKHIEIDLHFVRNQVFKGNLQVNHILATYQKTGTLTKSLSKRNFIRFRSDLKSVENQVSSELNQTHSHQIKQPEEKQLQSHQLPPDLKQDKLRSRKSISNQTSSPELNQTYSHKIKKQEKKRPQSHQLSHNSNRDWSNSLKSQFCNSNQGEERQQI